MHEVDPAGAIEGGSGSRLGSGSGPGRGPVTDPATGPFVGGPPTGPGVDRPRGTVLSRLGVRVLGPYVVYSLLQSRTHNELIALAVGAAIPVVAGAAVAVHHRRVDWALVASAASLLVSLVIAALIGHGSTIVKLRGAVAPTVLGVLMLATAAASGPWRRRIFRALQGFAERHPARRGRTGPMAEAGSWSPERRREGARRLRRLLVLWGVGLLVVATVHVVIVFTVSTSAYLVTARVATLGLLALLFVLTRLLHAHWSSAAA